MPKMSASTSSTSQKSKVRPWEPYRRLLMGNGGALPPWIANGRPTGFTPQMEQYLQGLSSGNLDSIMNPAPLDIMGGGGGPFTYGLPRQQMPMAPQQPPAAGGGMMYQPIDMEGLTGFSPGTQQYMQVGMIPGENGLFQASGNPLLTALQARGGKQ